MKNLKRYCSAVIIAASLGCTGAPPSNREAGALGGAALGAGLGAIVGHATHNTGAGIAIGAGAGALAGAAIGNAEDTTNQGIDDQEERLRRQQMEIEKQNREIEDLRRQQYQNDRFRPYDAPQSGNTDPDSSGSDRDRSHDSF